MILDIVINKTAMRCYLTIIIVYTVGVWMMGTVNDVQNWVEDMETALEVERPVRTRSELAEVPFAGPIFQAACDAYDFAWFNGGLARKYIPAIPAVMAIPTILGAVSTVRSFLTLPSMLMALVSVPRV